MAWTTSKIRGGRVLVGLLLGAAGCGDDGPSNVLPPASDSSSGATVADATVADTAMADTTVADPDTGVDVTADTTAGGGTMFPATYRFDCIDIVEIGDGNEDGQPDGESIQGTLLENTWAADIVNFKLNILLTVSARDDMAGTAELLIGSGIGPDAASLCTEPTTASEPQMAGFDAAAAQWQPSSRGACAEPAAGTGGFGGTYTFELGAADTVYIYAQDTDGTVFNCVPGDGAPDAVPLHAIQATVTVDENDQVAAGQLSGCLVDAEAQGLCSCLGVCTGSAHADCDGCPDGSVPLAQLLAGVGATDNCTQIMGETAYDLTVGFTTRRLAVAEPMLCE
jgi:hypothetical protein